MRRRNKDLVIMVWIIVAAVQSSRCETFNGSSNSGIPSVVNIGGLFTLNSVIGRGAHAGISAAIHDVNADPNILPHTKLQVIYQDTNCSGFLGIIGALKLMENNVMAIIGPQSSGIAHTISHVANEIQVPLLSFAATDPTLTSTESPYFLRTTHSDYYQMTAVADLVGYYGWRQVVAIYVDDDHGRNAIPILSVALGKKLAKVAFLAALNVEATQDDIHDMLISVNSLESRVYVVHAHPEFGMRILGVAKHLGMMGKGTVWIATDWLASRIDADRPMDSATMSLAQGVLAIRHHIPQSTLKDRLLTTWKRFKDTRSEPNSFALYAYDSVWATAKALHLFLNENGDLSRSYHSKLTDMAESQLRLESLRIFNGGRRFLQLLTELNFTGVSGKIEFDDKKNLIRPAFDILNIVGMGVRSIGFWSNETGLSSLSPEELMKVNATSVVLRSVIWPGDTADVPRGWVYSNNGHPLRIGFPLSLSYLEFVSVKDNSLGAEGFCVDIFEEALTMVPYPVPHVYIPFGDGIMDPSYDELVQKLADNVFDAVVGDVTVTTNRTRTVDFTQPYIESGLVVVAAVNEAKSNPWAFLTPFTPSLWGLIGCFFLVVGTVVWILEHRINEEFRGSGMQQIKTIFWFSFSTMFFSHRENTMSSLGRFVMIIWMFVVLIINSSYTASLTSILTVRQLVSNIKGIDTLILGTSSIGVQEGSFAYDYLISEYHVAPSRLVKLQGWQHYSEALRRGTRGGGVDAIVDELPYVEAFMAKTNCRFRVVGEKFSRNGWGFVFQKNSPLALDVSTAVLQLSENGRLQKIHDMWLTNLQCSMGIGDVSENRIHLNSFYGLFLIFGAALALAVFIFTVRTFLQYRKAGEKRELHDRCPVVRRRRYDCSTLKDLIYFMDTKHIDFEDDIRRSTSNSSQQVIPCSQLSSPSSSSFAV